TTCGQSCLPPPGGCRWRPRSRPPCPRRPAPRRRSTSGTTSAATVSRTSAFRPTAATWPRPCHWVNEWMGARDTLAARSPVNLAARIKAPVLLVAGGADTIAPISHSRRMRRALEAHDLPVRTLYVDSEGHGFRSGDDGRGYYAVLPAVRAGHLGGAAAQ